MEIINSLTVVDFSTNNRKIILDFAINSNWYWKYELRYSYFDKEDIKINIVDFHKSRFVQKFIVVINVNNNQRKRYIGSAVFRCDDGKNNLSKEVSFYWNWK
jgi:hypothetical protein